MSKEEIIEAANQLLFQDTSHLGREDYKDLLHEIIDNCKASLSAMSEEEDIEEG